MWDSAVFEDKKKIARPPSPPRTKQLSDQRGVAHVFHGSDFFYTRTSPLNTASNSTFTPLVYCCMHSNKYSWCAPLYQVNYRRPWTKHRPRFTPDIFGVIKILTISYKHVNTEFPHYFARFYSKSQFYKVFSKIFFQQIILYIMVLRLT